MAKRWNRDRARNVEVGPLFRWPACVGCIAVSFRQVIPTSTPTSTTTFGTAQKVNMTGGWAAHELALGTTHTAFNSNVVAGSTSSCQSVDGTYAYSSDALA